MADQIIQCAAFSQRASHGQLLRLIDVPIEGGIIVNARDDNAARHADSLKGACSCRTMRGDHRGVSVFDKKNTRLGNFDWYKIPAGTKLPEAIAITRDASRKEAQEPIHHTVAPKDDMPLSLFLQYLKLLAGATTKD